MLRRTLNLGILAHVDAGKTSLTERLLYAAGVIDEIGSVDAGNTQTDSLALERQRGITIKSAVVSFDLDDVTVNLIDTPGHPDFIAEVERVLSVLDGAVLVISAVEGVQAQTRVLMRALQRLRVPDPHLREQDRSRRRAGQKRVLRAISERLTRAIVPMGSTRDLGTRAADFTPYGATDSAFTARLAAVLAENDDAILAAYVDDESRVSHGRLCDALAAQTGHALVHPVFFGSAITGAGGDALGAGIARLLPGRRPRCQRPALGHGLQGRPGSGRREDRVRPPVLGSGPDPRPTGVWSAERGQGDRRRRLRPGRRRPAPDARRGPDRQALGPRRRQDRRRDRQAAADLGRAPVRLHRPWRRSSCLAVPPTRARCTSR